LRVVRHANLNRIVIDPGEYYVSKENLIISTLLGSCVSACLWDPIHRVVGMNHFLLAHKRYQQDGHIIESEAGRYGIHSMELLINSMLKLGAQRRLLRAKAFGGGNVLPTTAGGNDNFYAVGEVNSRFIREFLDSENIPLDKSHLGGKIGRVIHFHSMDYSVYMKRIEHQREVQVIEQEHRYWEREIRQHDQEEQHSRPLQIWD
jgi:chemotaxis protein CheD